MRKFERISSMSFALTLSLFCGVTTARAITSPYVTQTTEVPLDQSSTDTVNGTLPWFSHSPREGASASVTDATSPNAPTDNVILGPDNTWIGVAWDFSDPPPGQVWKLDRFDAWIAAGDNLRKGYRADISLSLTGGIDDFAILPNSEHWAGLTWNAQFNHIRYDFPSEYIVGATPDMDRYPAIGFRHLRFNSLGDSINNVWWQTRFVELDIWVSAIPMPETAPVIQRWAYDSTNNTFGFTWSAIMGRQYDVMYKLDFQSPEWTLLETINAGAPRLSYTNTSVSDAKGFYSVILQP